MDERGNVADQDYGGIGDYTLSVACVLSNGTVVNPGDPQPDPPPQLVMVAVPLIDAQAVATVQCGDVVAAEFTRNAEVHNYALDMVAGDNAFFRVQFVPIGATLRAGIAVVSPGGNVVINTGNYGYPITLPAVETPVLSERGTYRIFVSNARMDEKGNVADQDYGGIGNYTLSFGCTMPDGTTINPGTNLPIPQSFSGNGFPGLPAINFTKAIIIPYTFGTPMASAITPDRRDIYGYTFDGTANTTIGLNFTRLSGNMNLGVVVFYQENQVIYQGTIITGNVLDGQFTLPADGQYTIGVFGVDLLPPDAPEPTTFQLQATSQ